MRLCYICEATQGGALKHLSLLVRHFARPGSGFDVSAILGDRGEPGFAKELEAWRGLGVQIKLLPVFQRAPNLMRDFSALSAVKKALAEINPDIVHTHCSKAGYLGRRAAYSLRQSRAIHTPHIFPFQWSTGFTGYLYGALERQAVDWCEKIICVGADQRAAAIHEAIAPEQKFELIRNGVALPDSTLIPTLRKQWRERLEIPADALAVGVVARLTPQKDNRMFLEAARRVRAQIPKVHIRVVGSGPLESELKAHAEALGLMAPEVQFSGFLEGAETVYPAFDVLALSSLYEGLPYVLLEAAAWGLPVTATDVHGTREVLKHEQTGLLSPPGDAMALAAGLVSLLQDEKLRAQMGAAGRERVAQDFTLESFFEAHTKLYTKYSQT